MHWLDNIRWLFYVVLQKQHNNKRISESNNVLLGKVKENNNLKKLFKYILIFLLLVLLAVAAFVYTFDANQYKDEMAEVVGSIIGRPVSIRGDVDISVYPWIGVKINDMTIDNNSGFSRKKFASIGQFDISVRIIPLFQKQLDIDKLVMHRLAVDFEKNAAGENNWSDLSGATGGSSAVSEFGLVGLVLGGIELEDASFSWLDANTGKRFNVSKMSLNTEAVIKGLPLPVTLKAYVESNQPEWRAAVSAKANLEFNEDSPTFNANDLKLSVKAFLPGEKKSKVSFAMVSDSSINWQENTAKLTKTRFSIFGLILSGTFDVENIFSVPTIQGPLKVKTFEAGKLAKRLKIDITAMANSQSLKNISLKTSFKTDFDTIYLDDIYANVDKSHVKGFVHITDMSKAVIRYKLDVDKIAMHDYRPVDDDSENDEIMIPLDLIRSADLEGSLNVENVAFDDVELTEFYIASEIKDGILKANPVKMWVDESEVKAAMVLDARSTPLGKFVVSLKHVDARASINPLLKTIMGDDALVLDGMVNADVNIKTRGVSVAAHKASAQGAVKIDMDKVIVRGIDLDHASKSVVADYANKNKFRTRKSYVPEYKPDLGAEFNSLSASFKIANGKLVNKDLSLISEKANITGSGSIDFINSKLDYRPIIDIKVKSRVDIRDKLRDHLMEFHAQGTFENIKTTFEVDKYELLVGRLLIQESKARRNKQLNTRQKKLW